MNESEFTQEMKALGWSDESIQERLAFYHKWTEIFLKDGFPPPALEEYLVSPEDEIHTHYTYDWYKNKFGKED